MHLDLVITPLPSGQLAGTVGRADDGVAIAFRGTFELVTALEHLLTTGAPAPEP